MRKIVHLYVLLINTAAPTIPIPKLNMFSIDVSENPCASAYR